MWGGLDPTLKTAAIIIIAIIIIILNILYSNMTRDFDTIDREQKKSDLLHDRSLFLI